MKRVWFISLFFVFAGSVFAEDWPVYKGNQYFTGNNDEMIVKGNAIRFIYRAPAKVENPIVSDGLVYFLDQKKNLFCIRADNGRQVWRANLKDLSRTLGLTNRSYGKIKYPLIKGDRLFISDSKVIYAFNKYNGSIIWARTGMRNDIQSSMGSAKSSSTSSGRFQTGSRSRVDGIYSDPVIADDKIFYGTRKIFTARELGHGRPLWFDDSIQTYSAFPTFHDRFVFTQSMNYSSGTYSVHCLDQQTGKQLWSTQMPKPFKIFSPVVYKGSVYIPDNKTLYALDLQTGKIQWQKAYEQIITSAPSFSDDKILFTAGNKELLAVSSENGEIKHRIATTEKPSSPRFLTIRDLVYVAHQIHVRHDGQKGPYTRVFARSLDSEKTAWSFSAPFKGGPSQPVASGSVMYLPAGNFLYAIGTPVKGTKTGDDYLAYIDGRKDIKNDTFNDNSIPQIDPWISETELKDNEKISEEDASKHIVSGNDKPAHADEKGNLVDDDQIPMREVPAEVTDSSGAFVPSRLTIIKRFNSEIVYRNTIDLKEKVQKIKIPDDDDIEISATAGGFTPSKVIIDRSDKEVSIKTTRISRGEKFTSNAIRFETGSAYLTVDSRDYLMSVALFLKKDNKLNMLIIGHTDSRGSDSYNMTLSKKRAAAVRDFLIKQGISPERLSVDGKGEKEPVAKNTSPRGRAANRRTEFRLL